MYAIEANAFSGGGGLVAGLLYRLTRESSPALTESGRAALIEAVARSADRGAFIALFEFYAPRIKSQAMRFGLDASVAEDIAQDAMLALWRRAAQFDPARGSASAWVFSISTNARIDRMRRDRIMAASVELDGQEPMMAAAADDGAADAARLQEIVSKLPEEQRQMVQLSFYRDIPHSQIASQLNVPLGTVKSRIRLAIGKLRQALQDKS